MVIDLLDYCLLGMHQEDIGPTMYISLELWSDDRMHLGRISLGEGGAKEGIHSSSPTRVSVIN